MMRGHLKSLLIDIFRGEDRKSLRRPGFRQVVTSEDGLITWATLIAVILFCALIAMVFNVGRIANDKLEAQNAADSAAYSASLVQARAMNAITASNHMMGELTALYTMHHAIGGEVLDERGTKNNLVVIGLNLGLYGSYGVAWVASLPTLFVGGSTPESIGPTDDVPRGEATVYDAKCMLKLLMIEQYANHLSGSEKIVKGIATSWFFGAGIALIKAGIAQQKLANFMMKKLKQEYRFINTLETAALAALPIKNQVLPGIMSALWTYEKMLAGDLIPVFGAHTKSLDAARFAATQNKCIGEVVGRPTFTGGVGAQLGLSSAVLPIRQDPCTNPKKSQLMRATYPWIQEWRSIVLLTFDGVATLSRAARFYEYHSDQYAKDICKEFHNDKGYKLYVLEKTDSNSSSSDKGTESWRLRNNSEEADRLFCVVGFARKQNSPSMTHHSIWPDTNTKPIAAFSQAMIYNVNRPTKWEMEGLDYMFWMLGREGQPVEGWDMLNWTEGATEWKDGKPYFNLLPNDFHWILGKFIALDAPFVYPPDIKLPPIPVSSTLAGPPTPKVELNWQSKLVPVSKKTLRLRALMVRDSQIRERMTELTTLLWAPALYPDAINH